MESYGCGTSRPHVVLSMSITFGALRDGNVVLFPFKDARISRKFLIFVCTVCIIGGTKHSMYASCFCCVRKDNKTADINSTCFNTIVFQLRVPFYLSLVSGQLGLRVTTSPFFFELN